MAKDATIKERLAIVETEAKHAKEAALAMSTTCKETHKALDETIKGFSGQLTTQEEKMRDLVTAVDNIQKTLDNGLTAKIVATIRSTLSLNKEETEQTRIQKITALAPYVVAIISAAAAMWIAYFK